MVPVKSPNLKPLAHLGDGRQAIWHVGELQAGRGGQVAGELARDLRGDVASWWFLNGI